MIFNETIAPENVAILDQTFDHKEDLLRYMLDTCLVGTEMQARRDAIQATLLERERSMSTGVGLGVAIPHCSSEYVPEATGCFSLLKQPIEFDAVDEIPVQIVILILMPRKKYDRHISILASIAKIFNNEKTRNAVLKARTPEKIVEIVQAAS